MNLQELQEKRSQALAALRSMTDKIEGEKREATAVESKQFTDNEKEVRSLNDRIERQRFLEEQERAEPVMQARRGNDGTFQTRCRDFRITRAMAAQLEPNSVDAGSERETSAELARRDGKKPQGILVPHEALQTRALLTSGDGAPLYPERTRGDLYIDRLREQLTVAKLGATVLTGLTGDQDIPRLAESVTASWVGEHEAVPASDARFNSVRMSPKTCGAETEYSRRMILNASPSVETLMRNDLATVIATAIDREAIIGDGQNNKPVGIINTAGTVRLPMDDSQVDDPVSVQWAEVLEFIERLSTDNALNGRLGWLVPPKFVTAARSSVRSTTGTDVMVMEQVRELAGFPLYTSNHVPIDQLNSDTANRELFVLFGAWQDLMIGYWSSVDILLNPYHSDVYSRGGVRINALQDVDIAVRHPESFVVGTAARLA